MIDGNGYDNLSPSKTIYIRWIQIFMPVVQFSYTYMPYWDFDQQITIC